MRFLRKKIFKRGLGGVLLRFTGKLAKRGSQAIGIGFVGKAVDDVVVEGVRKRNRGPKWMLIALAVIAIITFLAVLFGFISPEFAEKILKLF